MLIHRKAGVGVCHLKIEVSSPRIVTKARVQSNEVFVRQLPIEVGLDETNQLIGRHAHESV
jgi:hypothetical protein